MVLLENGVWQLRSPAKMAATVSCVVIESSFDPGERLHAPGSLWFKVTLNVKFQFISVPEMDGRPVTKCD